MSTATITWLGHGTVVVETAGSSVIVDPVLRNRIAHLRRRTPLDRSMVPDVDAVLVTHAHHDHLDVSSLRSFPAATPKLAPRGADRVMRMWGAGSVRTVEVGASLQVGDIGIETVRARHAGSRLLASRTAVAVGFVLRPAGGPSIFLAGDTALHDDMSAIAPIDVAVLPVGGWWRGPADTEHLDPDQALEAARLVDARIFVPIHWGTFHPVFLRRFMDPVWAHTLEHLQRLAQAAPELDLRVLEPGGSTIVDVQSHAPH